MIGILINGSYWFFGAVVGSCEGLHKACTTLARGDVVKEGGTQAAAGLPALLEGLQLSPDDAAKRLPDACIAHCLALEPSQKAVFIFVDAVFMVAAKRSSKAAAWAPEYARLCALFKRDAQRLQLGAVFQDALYGRCLQEYGRVCSRTLAVDVRGRTKSPSQVAEGAEELRGGLRFVAALFKSHMLPGALVRGLAADLAAHTAAGLAALHCQSLVAAALVALLQGCVDAYVCEAGAGGGIEDGGANLGATEVHIRAVGLALLRLQTRVDPLDELKAELEALHFKLTSYASTVYGAAHQALPHQQHLPPAQMPHVLRARRSEDLLRAAHLQGTMRWPSSQL